mmetsp:Transcript_55162/g.98207  ORF Transcript_55162/g.98207 Transcript_55162/m.98207 type:complete len:221 (-) Transcript_55162:50-712(-)
MPHFCGNEAAPCTGPRLRRLVVIGPGIAAVLGPQRIVCCGGEHSVNVGQLLFLVCQRPLGFHTTALLVVRVPHYIHPFDSVLQGHDVPPQSRCDPSSAQIAAWLWVDLVDCLRSVAASNVCIRHPQRGVRLRWHRQRRVLEGITPSRVVFEARDQIPDLPLHIHVQGRVGLHQVEDGVCQALVTVAGVDPPGGKAAGLGAYVGPCAEGEGYGHVPACLKG